MTNSRISGFYKMPIIERQQQLAKAAGLDLLSLAQLSQTGGIDLTCADLMIENVVATYSLPFAVALNFKMNGQDVLVPMVIEEPSVVAAASHAALLARHLGGFECSSESSWMIAQVELQRVPNIELAIQTLTQHTQDILALSKKAQPGLVQRGGGAKDIEFRVIAQDRLVVHVFVDCCDAMGANAVNTVAEAIGPYLAHLIGAQLGLRILSNLCDRRRAFACCQIPVATLAIDQPDCVMSGEEVRDRMIEAYRFAMLDPYRAVTHNKGIMNGIDAVAMATAQDWRGIEAGAHAYAARHGRYLPLSCFSQGENGQLMASIEIPLAVGTVGGSVGVHAGAQKALSILGSPSARVLAEIMAACGLASNIAALRALATEGIQRGHMNLHERRFHESQDATLDLHQALS